MNSLNLAYALGNGHYSNNWFETGTLQAIMLLQMNVHVFNKKTNKVDIITVVSDTTWKTALGPIVTASVYDGEVFDDNGDIKGSIKTLLQFTKKM